MPAASQRHRDIRHVLTHRRGIGNEGLADNQDGGFLGGHSDNGVRLYLLILMLLTVIVFPNLYHSYGSEAD
jgi:hypothetical protein